MQQENEQLQKIINESSSSVDVTADNIDMHVKPQNPLSERLIKFHCKI